MTADLIRPGTPQYRELFDAFSRSVFRLETLQAYEPDASLEAFRAGYPEPPDPHHDAWCERIAAQVRSGKTVQRVHVVREPVSDYMAYELTWGYAPNARAGEDVRVIPIQEGDPWPDLIPQHDLWLFDDARLFELQFGPSGELLGVRPAMDQTTIDAARIGRDHAQRVAITWLDYMADRPDLARHLDLARAS